MKRIARTVLFALLASAVLTVAPAAAQDNTATAVNTKDGKSVFKLAFSVKEVTGDVDARNTAVAYSSCTDCKTVAAAIQIVLISDPDDVIVRNQVLAVNYQCVECETLARAYQFVFASGAELEFTKEGKAALHDLRKRFYDLKQRDDLTLQQLATEIAVIAGEVLKVVDTELIAVEDKKAEPTTTTTAGSAGVTSTSSPPTTGTLSPTTTAAASPTTTAAPPTSTTTVGVTTTTAG